MGKIIIEIVEIEDNKKEMKVDIKMTQPDIVQSTRALVKECERLTEMPWAIIEGIEDLTTKINEVERTER